MKMPTRLFVVDGAEQTKLLLMPCVTHGSHVVLGGGLPGGINGALHMHVDEVQQLVDILRAGVLWSGLVDVGTMAHAEPGDVQGSVVTRSGMFGVSVLHGRYVFSWATKGFPPGIVLLDDAGRERAILALLELLHGKAAAA
jgi:hypothetical protein